MRIGTDKLIVKALHALEDANWQAQRGPVDPSFALRFALAFLYAHSHAEDRESFDSFWKIVTDHPSVYRHPIENIHNTCRSTHASRELYRIYRAVGVYRSTEMMFHSALARKRSSKVVPP